MGPITTGTIIAGRYRVMALIGDGSMGAVYHVEEEDSHEAYALKVLHSDWSRHPDIIARFEREAIAASRIDHPNVVHATDFGCSSDGSFYLVLEYVDGRDLRAEVQAGPMEAGRAIHIMRGVVAGIRAAHEKGDHSPRSQTREHHARRAGGKPRLREAARLRDRAARLGQQPAEQHAGAHHRGSSARHARVHVARAGARQSRRRSHRSLFARRDLLRAAHGRLSVRRQRVAPPAATSHRRGPPSFRPPSPPRIPTSRASCAFSCRRSRRIVFNRRRSSPRRSARARRTAHKPAPAKPGSPPSESRTLASLAMRASLAKKRLVGIVAPQARRHAGARRAGLIAAACCAAALLVALVVVVTRDRSAPESRRRSESERQGPDRPRSHRSRHAATNDRRRKRRTTKPRRKSSEGPTPPRGKAK